MDVSQQPTGQRLEGWLRHVIIRDHERAIVIENGRATRWLEPGRHVFLNPLTDLEIVRYDLNEGLTKATPELLALCPNNTGEALTINANHGGVLVVNGQPQAWIEPGRYVRWTSRHDVQVTRVDLADLRLELDAQVADLVPRPLIRPAEFHLYERGLLFVDDILQAWIEPGQHYFSQYNRKLVIKSLKLHQGITSWRSEWTRVVPEGTGQELVVAPHEAAFFVVDDQPEKFLEPGRYMMWTQSKKTEVVTFDMRALSTDLPEAMLSLLPPGHVLTQHIQIDERAIVYRNGMAHAWLEPGRHHLWLTQASIRVHQFDLNKGATELTPDLQTMMPEDMGTTHTVPADHGGVLFINSKPRRWLESGRYVVWQKPHVVHIETHDLTELRANVTTQTANLLAKRLCARVIFQQPFEARKMVLHAVAAFV